MMYQIWAINPVAPDYSSTAWRRGEPVTQTKANVTVRRLNRRRPFADDVRYVSLPVGETPPEYVEPTTHVLDDESAAYITVHRQHG
jgi:hypothetical protein